MEATNTREELKYLVRALSHDMSANFMLLEDSFAQFKKALGKNPPSEPPDAAGSQQQINVHAAHVEACMRESRRFLDDLVRLAQTGNVDMEAGRVEVARVVEDVLFEQHDLLRRRQVDVAVERPLPVVWCNAGRLKQVVTNLVRNAAYHGCDRGRPQLTIASHSDADADDDTMTAFEVHDNGPGIEPTMRREIFLPGKRLATADAEGSGMGLAIVKKIVDYYGGEVYVDPECRAGTAMVVSLPAIVQQPAESTGAARRSRTDEDRRRWKLEPEGHRAPGAAPLHGSVSHHSHGRR